MKFFYRQELLAGSSYRLKTTMMILASILVSMANGQRSEPFLFGCVGVGQPMTIDAEISNAPATSFYHWQFKVGAGDWTCFRDGMNVVNGTNFNVTGSTKLGGANDAPLLTIEQATMALDNVLIRLLIGNGSDPCLVTSPVWGGDDQGKQDTKYLRLHVFAGGMACPPNSYSCPDNVVVDGTGYYGGFEHIAYNSSNGSYTKSNFGTYASTDLAFGSAAGSYQDINNPYAMNATFARNIAPHSGNYQLVVAGAANTNTRAWFKSNVSVIPGSQYRFAVWVARVDNTDPVISLKIRSGATMTSLVSYDMFPEPIGSWRLIQGNYSVPSGVSQVDISIGDTETGGLNNYVLDDICFRECFNCGTLPLHQLELRAYLQGSTISLKWVAENEMNTSSFVIERSVDGSNYTGIGSKLPTGALNTVTNYQFDDNVAGLSSANLVYYRIKAMDNDSRYAYSNVTTIKLGNIAGIQVWPNPAESFINISYNASSNTTVDISLINSQGSIFKQQLVKVSRGMNQLAINDISRLPAGMYLLRISDLNTGKISTTMISK